MTQLAPWLKRCYHVAIVQGYAKRFADRLTVRDFSHAPSKSYPSDGLMIQHVYTAERSIVTPRRALREMIDGVRESRYMAYRLAAKGIKAQYAKSVFGMLWDLVDPLVLGLIFYALMKFRVIQPGDTGMPYAIFVIYGLLLYQTFMESLLQTVNIFAQSKGLLTHVKLPPEALIMSIGYRMAFFSLFRIVVMLVFSLVLYGVAQAEGLNSFSPLGFLFFLALYPVVILWGMAFGLFLAPFNVIYNDVGRVTRIVLNPLRYLSPVIWPIPVPLLAYINPVAPLIENLRSLATQNVFETPGPFVGWLLIVTVVFMFSWYVFHVSVPVLAERA